jgi:hypothetical protein
LQQHGQRNVDWLIVLQSWSLLYLLLLLLLFGFDSSGGGAAVKGGGALDHSVGAFNKA